MMKRQRKWQLKQVANGRCPRCGNKVTEHYYCETCNDKHNAQQNKYYANLKQVELNKRGE